MVVVKWILIALAVLVLAALGVSQLGWLGGTAPTDLGVNNGRLKPPALTPNSVSSQASLYPDHPQRAFAQIAPLALQGDGPSTLAKLKAILQARGDVAVVKSEPDYLYVRYTSRWMRFVDDVEFWFDPVQQVIQVRSASRIGKGDMGVNRARVESLRASLSGAATSP
ncbi:DUF1499 domain-containing protein [Rhodoferax sp. AJA081-3]|uniref:DUF1499 domain-containing protein n=1 Tax=Rhodoferax sp. AJA081-3 TaxID=2752316 RepID=UPI001AE0D0FE|nr:DUF1499 domain-containing protein [Rhodoferax sp. AJA081-3]QTN27265.1 DUF1499 domain-containing protein [Rhodoferax sp. AJA081-3]